MVAAVVAEERSDASRREWFAGDEFKMRLIFRRVAASIVISISHPLAGVRVADRNAKLCGVEVCFFEQSEQVVHSPFEVCDRAFAPGDETLDVRWEMRQSARKRRWRAGEWDVCRWREAGRTSEARIGAAPLPNPLPVQGQKRGEGTVKPAR